MINRDASSLVLVGAASFVISFGIMLWNRKTDAVPFPDPMTRSAPAPIPRTNIPPQSPPRAEEIREPAPVAAAGSEATLDMPLQVIFTRPLKSTHLIGRMFNSSAGSMTVAVSIEEASTSAVHQTQVKIPANSWVSFGGDGSLELEPGNRVTLQSAPYPDLVTVIP
jgi:hypothetical protein